MCIFPNPQAIPIIYHACTITYNIVLLYIAENFCWTKIHQSQIHHIYYKICGI